MEIRLRAERSTETVALRYVTKITQLLRVQIFKSFKP